MDMDFISIVFSKTCNDVSMIHTPTTPKYIHTADLHLRILLEFKSLSLEVQLFFPSCINEIPLMSSGCRQELGEHHDSNDNVENTLYASQTVWAQTSYDMIRSSVIQVRIFQEWYHTLHFGALFQTTWFGVIGRRSDFDSVVASCSTLAWAPDIATTCFSFLLIPGGIDKIWDLHNLVR